MIRLHMVVEGQTEEEFVRSVLVSHLEEAFAADLVHPRFVPYLQLFEFEALLLADPVKFADWFIGHEAEVQTLVAMTSRFSSPELIDDGEETAPSKRIIKVIPAYAGAKISAGPVIVDWIGLPTMRGKCPHFDQWLSRLEGLGAIVTR